MIDRNERESVWQLIENQLGWHKAVITAQDYQQIAEHFRTPASMMRPNDDIVFDAFFYEDLLSSHSELYANREWENLPDSLGLAKLHELYANRKWENLPDSLGLANLQYTTDYRFAFYDRETGLFICYDEEM